MAVEQRLVAEHHLNIEYYTALSRIAFVLCGLRAQNGYRLCRENRHCPATTVRLKLHCFDLLLICYRTNSQQTNRSNGVFALVVQLTSLGHPYSRSVDFCWCIVS